MFEGRLQHDVFWSPLPGTGSSSVVWTKEEDKVFENSLVRFPEDAPDRWDRIASLLPGKTTMDVVNHYKALLQDVMDIETGRIVLPGYCDDADDDDDFGSPRATGHSSFKSSKGKEERKKGIPWTEEEHRRFLDGLERYGKGDWRSISRNAVVTRTPTQVASHAQKYFIRLNSSGKRDKKRGSIHDTKP